MGAFLSVAQGAMTSPWLLEMRYNYNPDNGKPVVLVGKGKYMYTCVYICTCLMRDEKEGRMKQARSNKQQGKATQHTQGSHCTS